MSADPSQHVLQRASLLLQQRRYDMAHRELRNLLADDPENVAAHALLSVALSQDERIGEDARTEIHREQLRLATHHAEQAVALEPGDPSGHYAMAIAALRRNRHRDAIAAAEQAIRLDPHDADYHAALSMAEMGRRNFSAALSAAEQGLSNEPEHARCGNLRALALDRLGRGGDAIATAGEQLRRNPESSHAHAILGFAHLNRGEHRQAKEAFREALRLDPTDEFARQGMIQAIHTGNPVYRWLFYVLSWLGRLDARVSFALMIGLYLLVNNIGVIANQLPFIEPYQSVVIMAYLIFALTTWIATPLMNMLLRLHPFGRHLLNGPERWTSNLVAGAIGSGLILMLVLGSLVSLETGFIALVYFMIVAVMVCATMQMPFPRQKWIIGGLSVVALMLPVAGLVAAVVLGDDRIFGGSLRFFIYGVLGIQIGSQIWAAQPRRV